MATNPMQKKARASFLLGMVVMLIIAALVVAMLYMKIKNQEEELKKIKLSSGSVYILNQDVKSGQVLTSDMFKLQQIARDAIPANATTNITATLASYSLTTKDGKSIYYNPGTPGNSEDPTCYYVGVGNERKPLYQVGSQGTEAYVTFLQSNDKVYYYAGPNRTQKTEVEVSENAVVAKVDLNTNTVITSSLLSRSNEVTTNDLRKEEYNVIALPVDLAPGDYVDVRLMLPNGQNYIVTSKKEVKIPAVNGQYLADTIQMNLTEEEILLLSCAIIENYQIEGSKLYATRYTEAGVQSAATVTYYPNNEVQTLLSNDPNVVRKAINGIVAKRQAIRDAINASVSKDGKDENIGTKSETSITSTIEQRKNYLQTLPVIP